MRGPRRLTGRDGNEQACADTTSVPTKSVAARIEARIHVIRGERVMLDADLAALYGVETRTLNQAVSRNRRRFPDDFMFRLTAEEVSHLTSQSVMSSSGAHGGRRHTPLAFTEQGVAMLSSVRRIDVQGAVLGDVLRALRALERPMPQKRRKIGFRPTT